jgi:hypothetical protein
VIDEAAPLDEDEGAEAMTDEDTKGNDAKEPEAEPAI